MKRFSWVIGLVMLAACTPGPVAGGVTGGAAGGISTDPATVDPSPFLEGATPTRPRPSAAGAPATPASTTASARPVPSPSPSPQRLEGPELFLDYPGDWKVESGSIKPLNWQITPGYEPASFTVTAESTGVTLERRREVALQEAGAGVVSSELTSLDGVRGYLVTSNQDRPEGKRFVTERGFHYREMFFRVRTSWDKRSANADRVARDVQAILRTYKWL